MNSNPPKFPQGPFVPVARASDEMRRCWIAEIGQLSSQLRSTVDGLSESQLDTKYQNWTIRQIVHHVTDSHLNSYIRFKWTLTEEKPTIKPYDEGLWSDLEESRSGSILPSLQLLDGLVSRWCQLLATLTPVQFERVFIHPDTNDSVSLDAALAYYAWHGKHHTAQISWLRNEYQF